MTDLDDHAVSALVRATFDHLTALRFNGNKITAAGLTVLADSDLAARSQWLNISGIKRGAGVTALIESTKLTNLKYLMASGRGLARLTKHFGKTVVVDA